MQDKDDKKIRKIYFPPNSQGNLWYAKLWDLSCILLGVFLLFRKTKTTQVCQSSGDESD